MTRESRIVQCRLVTLAAVWAAVGLLLGVTFRELTRGNAADPGMLGLMHGHTLVLGMFFMLIVALLEGQLAVSRSRAYSIFLPLWNVGLAVAVVMMFINGIRSLKSSGDHPALSGIAGLGHIALTIALIFFFRALFQALGASEEEQTSGQNAHSAGK